MQLRPFAPLVVIGAGLLVMTLASHPASADQEGAPLDVDVSSASSGLLVTWQAPGGSGGLSDYALLVSDPATGEQVLKRRVAAEDTRATLQGPSLAGLDDVTVTVVAEYPGGQRYPGEPVQVTLPSGPAQPASAPTVRLEGGRLKVLLPVAPEGVDGRVVQLSRDGEDWTTVSAPARKRSISRTAVWGHRYSAAYRDVAGSAASSLSQESALLVASESSGPAAVRTITVRRDPDGIVVRWSAARAHGAEVQHYRVEVVEDGTRVGSAFTSSAVRSVTVPGVAEAGSYDVTVTAEDADGGIGSTSAAVSMEG